MPDGIDQGAVRIAKRLYSRMSMTADPQAHDVARKHIASLLASYGHPHIAILLASTIHNVIFDRRDSQERVALLAEIRGLRERYDSVEIALVEAKAAAVIVGDPRNETYALAHLAELRDAHDTREIAAIEADAIFRVLRRTADQERRETLLARIAKIRQQHDHREIRVLLANALGCIAADHHAKLLEELLSNEDSSFAVEHARALAHAAAYTRDAPIRRALSAGIASVLLRFPLEQVAIALAEALLHTSAASSVPERVAIAEEIGGLTEQYPSGDIAMLYAWAMFLRVAEAGEDDLIHGIDGVIASYDCDEVASEPAQELLHAGPISQDAQLRHDVRNHIAKLKGGLLPDVAIIEQMERALD